MALTDKTLEFSDPIKPIIVIKEDEIDNTSTSLSLCPYNSLNSTNIINTSTLRLMEHFCSPTQPPHSTAGQLWVDTSGAPNEPDRLKVYIPQTPGALVYMDVAGTVISRTGTLRHTGQIEAVDDYNKISQADKVTLPEDLNYYKFLTTKRHCDENYLSGMTDDNTFYVRNDRRVVYSTDLTYTATLASPDSDEAAFLPRKYIDDNYLNGFNNPDNTFTITDNKPVYYAVDRVPTDLYELITKKYVYDVNAKLVQDYTALIQALLDRLNIALSKASTARTNAEAAHQAFMSLPTPTIATPIVIIIDATIPTVDPYIGDDTSPTLSGTITTLPNLSVGATYEVQVDGVVATGVVVSGNIWSLDSTSYAWTAPSTHTILVTRTESSGTSYANTTTDQIKIIFIPPPDDTTIPTVDPYTGTDTSPPLSGTITSSPTLSVGATYEVQVDGVVATGVSVSGNIWSLDSTSYAWTAPSTHTILVTRTESSGTSYANTTTDQIVITSIPPPEDKSIPTVDPYSGNDTSPPLSGTITSLPNLSAGATYEVQVDGVVATGVSVSGNIWSLDSTSYAWTAPSTHTILVTRTESSGTSYANTTTDQIVITSIPPPEDASIPTVDPYIGDDTSPPLSGTITSRSTLSAGATYEVQVDGVVATGVVVSGFKWSLDSIIYAWTAPSTHTILVTRTESSGTSYANTTTDQIKITSTPPPEDKSIPTVDPYTGTDTSPPLSGTITSLPNLSAGATYEVQVDGVVATGVSVSGNIWSLDSTSYAWTAPSTHTILVKRVEVSGTSYANTTTDQIKITSIPPPADTSIPTVDPYSGDDTSPPLSGTITSLPNLSAGATYEVKVDGVVATGVVVSGFKWSLDSTSYAWTAPSTHTILVKRVEVSGTSYANTTTDQIKIYSNTIIREDTSIPTVDTYTGTDTSPPLSGTITSLPNVSAGATYEVKVDGVVATGVVVSGLRWSLDSTSYAWTAPSTHTILVKRVEVSGTSYSSVGTDQIEIIALPVPQVPTVSPATGTTSLPIEVPDIEDIQISGTVGTIALGAGEQFTITVKKVGAAIGLVIPPTSIVVTGTTWTLNLPLLALGTTYDVTATRTDAAGVATKDTTSGELVVTTPANVAAPTLTPMVTSRKWPKISGTVGTIPITAGKDFKVKINNLDYTAVLDSTRLNWSVTLDRNEITQKLPLGAVNVIVKRFGKQSTERIINVVDYLRVYNPSTMHSAAYMNYSLKFLEEDLKVGYYMYKEPDALKVKITKNGVTTVLAQTEKNGVYSKVSYGYPSDMVKVTSLANARKHMHYFTIDANLIDDDVVLGMYINEGDAKGIATDFEYVLQVAGDLQPIEGKVLKEGKASSDPANWVPLVLGAYTINLDGSVTSL